MKKIYLLIIIIVSTVATMFAQGTGCPSVTASPDQTLPCTQSCTQISASVFEVGETNVYTVNPIPHSPPIAYNQGGGTAISVNTDDVWSNVIPLPFPFCFFGDTYNAAKIGSNGAIQLGPTPLTGGGYHPWPFTASVPSANLVPAGNIFGPYHDIDPSVAGSVRWYLLGSAPCRIFVVSFNNLGHYSCTSLRSTHMMVLYETTNIIEVYVQQKQTCNSWNSGNTVIGIQNNDGTLGYTPPDRNTGNWTVNTPEAWRFTPAGAPIYSTIEWLENGNQIGVGDSITVCPIDNVIYTARTTYTRCDGFQIQADDQISVNFSPNPIISVGPQNPYSCSGQNITLTANSNMLVNYNWSTGDVTSSVNVSPVATTTYTVTVIDPITGCSNTDSTTVNISQPTSTTCNVLYVTPTGSSSAPGTRANPMDLSTALKAGACNGTIIKMAVGTYTTDTTITGITSYLTLEGGFDQSVNWEKISNVGATTIFKTATMTTSLTSGNGIIDESGLDPRVVAIEISGQTGFRFQDITIQIADLTGGSPIIGYRGVTTKGIQLNNSSDYNIVRTNIEVGGASNGSNSECFALATDGGSSIGIDIIGNGANGNIISSNISAGVAGIGGLGCAPTYPLNGLNGLNQGVRLVSGTNLSQNDNNFNLLAQPIISMDDIACTFLDIGFKSLNVNDWVFGADSDPLTTNGDSVTTQYNSLGRKDINFAGNSYFGFANIILDDQILPSFITSAPFVQGQYRVCPGEIVFFTATNGGLGYVYIWDIEGNIVSGTSQDEISFPFPTPGVYSVELRYETSCCGLSEPTSIEIYVEEQPNAIVYSNQAICFGDMSGVELYVTGSVVGGSIEWAPPSGLNTIFSDSVIALPAATTSYTVNLSDSTGLCSSSAVVTVSVIDITISSSSTLANCDELGMATISVSGGSGNYNYVWSNGDSSSTIYGLQPDSYSVTVTDNVVGCEDSLIVNVLGGVNALIGTVSSSYITCFGGNSGGATVSVIGGVPPYTYTWSNGTNFISTDTFNRITNLTSGVYHVNVVDDSGCEYNGTVVLSNPSGIVMEIDSINHPTCEGQNDGFIRIQSSGGFRPYTYSWNNGVQVVEVNDGVNASNLSSGTYILTLIDDFNCTRTISVELNPLNEYSGAIDTTICSEDSIVINGTVYNRDRTSGVENYSLSNGCDSIVMINVNILNLPNSEVVSSTTVCTGDESHIIISGSPNSTISYSINNGQLQTTTIDSLGQTSIYSGILTEQGVITLLQVISHTSPACVVDLNDTYIINVVSEPSASIIAGVTCEGGESDLIVLGTPGSIVTYNIDGGSNQTVQLNSQGEALLNTGIIFNDVEYNLISVELPGTPSCTSVLNTSATVLIIDFPEAEIQSSDSICPSQETEVLITGTPGSYVVYSLNGVIDTIYLDLSGEVTIATGPLSENLTYELIEVVLGLDGCSQLLSGSAEITLLPIIAPLLEAFPDTIFSGDSSFLEVITGGVSFFWSPIESDTSILIVAPEISTEYTVRVIDENGCEAEVSVLVVVLENDIVLLIPDAFTPNGDGINDIFEVYNKEDFSEILLRVYNRWGELIHEEFSVNNHGWDGTFMGVDQPQDIYMYYIEATSINGEVFKIKGVFTLIR